MHFLCLGSGAPTVVVEAGLGDFSTDWELVQSRVATFARICVYDRAGYAWSEPGPFPRTFLQLNLELHEGLKALGERPPYILVGHSFGGQVVRSYASAYPGEVAGMVLVDTVQEDQRIPMGPHAARIRDFASGRAIPPPQLERRSSEQAPAAREAPSRPNEPLDSLHRRLSARGQTVHLWAVTLPGLEAAEDSQKEWSAESLALLHNSPQRGILGAMPLVVLTRAHSGYDNNLDVPVSQLEEERLATQRLLVELSTNSDQVIVASGHQMHLEAPEAVTTAIQRVIAAARARRPLQPAPNGKAASP